jgi:membrane protein
MFERITRFFQHDIWLLTPSKGQPFKTFFLKVTRMIAGASIGFIKDNCYLKASALTYYSLLSIVPVLAVAFGIAKGFGFESVLEHEIMHAFREQKDFVDKAIQFAYTLLDQTKGGVIAGVGVIVLFWTVFSLLGNIEQSLNDILKVKRARTYSRKFSDYLATMLICPIIFIVSSSLTLYIWTRFHQGFHGNSIFEAMNPMLVFAINIFPFVMAWILFTFIYMFMPNAHVRLSSGLVAGIIAGTAFQIWQWIYIKFQIGVSSYGAIYGSFAALPLFLIWVQVSWLIVLLGAEILACLERDPTLLAVRGQGPLKFISHKHLVLIVAVTYVRAFYEGLPPLTVRNIADELGVFVHIAQDAIDSLTAGRILCEVASPKGAGVAYQLNRDPRLLSIKSVCDIVDEASKPEIAIQESEPLKRISESLDDFDHLTEASKFNVSLVKLSESL